MGFESIIRFEISFKPFLLNKFRSSQLAYLCLVLLQVPKCFGLVQIFCARPKIHLHIVAVTNILCQTKRWFAFSKIGFCAGTKVFEEALNAVKFLGWLKTFGLAQNILGPVKGQGISSLNWWHQECVSYSLHTNYKLCQLCLVSSFNFLIFECARAKTARNLLHTIY